MGALSGGNVKLQNRPAQWIHSTVQSFFYKLSSNLVPFATKSIQYGAWFSLVIIAFIGSHVFWCEFMMFLHHCRNNINKIVMPEDTALVSPSCWRKFLRRGWPHSIRSEGQDWERQRESEVVDSEVIDCLMALCPWYDNAWMAVVIKRLRLKKWLRLLMSAVLIWK